MQKQWMRIWVRIMGQSETMCVFTDCQSLDLFISCSLYARLYTERPYYLGNNARLQPPLSSPSLRESQPGSVVVGVFFFFVPSPSSCLGEGDSIALLDNNVQHLYIGLFQSIFQSHSPSFTSYMVNVSPIHSRDRRY